MRASLKLSILIPCYNEPDTVGSVIESVSMVPLPPHWEREIIVIDDGSNAETKTALRNALHAYPSVRVLTRSENGGKGAALKTGFRAASGDYLVIQDADKEYEPADIATMLTYITPEKETVVFGSRNLSDNNVPGRFFYYWGGRAVNTLFNIAFGTSLTDLTTCYKLFPRSYLAELEKQPSNDFVFDAIELSRVIARNGVVEVPIRYRARNTAHGKKLRASDGIRCITRTVTLALGDYARVVRFVAVGGSAAVVNVALLYILTDGLGVWYLASEVVAFSAALAVNFFLQKFWTFENPHEGVARQGLLFILINLGNLALNTLILYLLVSEAHLWYIAAQLLASAVIAVESYFLYRRIFNTTS